MRAIGNIVTGDDYQTQTVVECGALNSLRKLFTNQKSQIVKEAAWAVSNIAAGNQSQIQVLLNNFAVLKLPLSLVINKKFCINKKNIL